MEVDSYEHAMVAVLMHLKSHLHITTSPFQEQIQTNILMQVVNINDSVYLVKRKSCTPNIILSTPTYIGTLEWCASQKNKIISSP